MKKDILHVNHVLEDSLLGKHLVTLEVKIENSIEIFACPKNEVLRKLPVQMTDWKGLAKFLTGTLKVEICKYQCLMSVDMTFESSSISYLLILFLNCGLCLHYNMSNNLLEILISAQCEHISWLLI